MIVEGQALAVVTGSSGGIGSEVARTLVGYGFHVLGLDQRPPNFDLANFEAVEVDLASPSCIESALARRSLSVGVVVHCAAEQPSIGAGLGGDLNAWARAYAVNVLALEHIVSTTRSELAESEPKRVIAIGSVHDKLTSNRIAPYSASKAALAAWIRAAALDLSNDGIAAVGISAGAVDSPKLREGLERFADKDAALANLLSKLPSGRLVAPRDVAELCLFLLGPAGQHLTGSNIQFDGGVSSVLASE